MRVPRFIYLSNPTLEIAYQKPKSNALSYTPLISLTHHFWESYYLFHAIHNKSYHSFSQLFTSSFHANTWVRPLLVLIEVNQLIKEIEKQSKCDYSSHDLCKGIDLKLTLPDKSRNFQK